MTIKIAYFPDCEGKPSLVVRENDKLVPIFFKSEPTPEELIKQINLGLKLLDYEKNNQKNN